MTAVEDRSTQRRQTSSGRRLPRDAATVSVAGARYSSFRLIYNRVFSHVKSQYEKQQGRQTFSMKLSRFAFIGILCYIFIRYFAYMRCESFSWVIDRNVIINKMNFYFRLWAGFLSLSIFLLGLWVFGSIL